MQTQEVPVGEFREGCEAELGAYILLLSAGLSQASILTTIEVEDSFGGVSVINAYTWLSGSQQVITGVDKTFTLPQFNPALGTLLSVEFRYTASSTFNLNMTGSQSNFQARGILGIQQYLLDSDGNVLFDNLTGASTLGQPGYLTIGTGTFNASQTLKAASTAQPTIQT